MRYQTQLPTIALRFGGDHSVAVTIPEGRLMTIVDHAEDDRFAVVEVEGERLQVFKTDLTDRCVARAQRDKPDDGPLVGCLAGESHEKESQMNNVAVSQKSPAPPLSRNREGLAPLFPTGRAFGLSPFSPGPFSMMREFSDQIDRMFRGAGTGPESEVWAPVMDIQQCNGSMVISAELPGLRKEDITVEVTDGELAIQGERKQEHREDHEGYHRHERSYGRFFRSIPLPETAKADQVKADLKDGVLKIVIPVAELTRKHRQVPVAG